MAGPLQGIRVLDLTQVLFGPFSTMIFSDLGAEVIKIERPEVGDIARGNGPFVRDISTYFLSVNRGKKSLTLDLSQEKGRELLLKLAEKVDVLVSWNFKQIVNLDRIHAFNSVNLKLGYPVLEIRSPMEVIHEKEI